jgi:hypothetical protein
LSGRADAAERRRGRRAEQRAVVPGDGFTAAMDRGAWSMTGQRAAAEWTWRPILTITLPMLVLATVAWFLLVEASVAGYVGFLIAMTYMVARGRRLHLRHQTAVAAQR